MQLLLLFINSRSSTTHCSPHFTNYHLIYKLPPQPPQPPQSPQSPRFEVFLRNESRQATSIEDDLMDLPRGAEDLNNMDGQLEPPSGEFSN